MERGQENLNENGRGEGNEKNKNFRWRRRGRMHFLLTFAVELVGKGVVMMI